MATTTLGLDIRSSTATALVLKRGLRHRWVAAVESVSFDRPEDLEAALAELLKRIRSATRLKACRCVVGFPVERMFFRNLVVPFRETRKIEQILAFEMEPLLPLSVEDLAIAYRPVDRGTTGRKTRLIAAGVQRSELDGYLAMLARLGLRPDAVLPGAAATALGTAFQADPPGDRVVIDVDDRHVAVCFFMNGQLCSLRSSRLPPRSSDAAVQVARTLRQTLSAFQDTVASDYRPQEICITGDQTVRDRIDIDEAPFQMPPWEPLNLAAAAGVAIGPGWGGIRRPETANGALALALADRRRIGPLNLQNGRFGSENPWGRYRDRMIRTAVLAAGVLMLAAGAFWADVQVLAERSGMRQRQIHALFKQTLPDVSRIEDPVHQMRTAVLEARGALPSPMDERRQPRVIDLMRDVSVALGTSLDIEITRSVIGPGNMLLEGNTNTFNAVDEMKSRLEQRGQFERVVIASTNKEKNGHRVRFKLNLEW